MRRSCLLAAVLLFAGARGGGAAGFALYDQSARGIGMGGAVTARASDPSAIFYNAAGIGFQEQRQLSIGSSVFTLSTDFTGDDPYPGAGREEFLDIAVPVPVGYYVHPVSDRAVLGIGVFAPFGLKTEWDDPDFSGRFISRVAKLDAIAVNPTIACRVSDRLSIGGGVDVRITSVQLERNVPFPNPFTGGLMDVASVKLESDTAVDVGFNLGVLFKPGGGLSLGAAYRHRVNVDFTGLATFTPRPTGIAAIDAGIQQRAPGPARAPAHRHRLPGIASVGAAYQAGGWTARRTSIGTSGPRSIGSCWTSRGATIPDQIIHEDYENSLQYRVGVERALGPSWAVRGGYYYDESPAPAASVSPLLPDPDRHGLAIGGSWAGRRARLDGALGYVIGRDRSTEGVNRDGFDGTYRSTGFVFSASVGYVF